MSDSPARWVKDAAMLSGKLFDQLVFGEVGFRLVRHIMVECPVSTRSDAAGEVVSKGELT